MPLATTSIVFNKIFEPIFDSLLYKLPKEKLLSSLNLINDINKNKNIEGKNVIDLRNPNYLILSDEQ